MKQQRKSVLDQLPEGRDFYSPECDKITVEFPNVINEGNIAFSASFNAPLISYGLGNRTSWLSLETAEKVSAAMRKLVTDRNHCIQQKFGSTVLRFIFWAVTKNEKKCTAPSFIHLMQRPDPLKVRDYLEKVWGGQGPDKNSDIGEHFYATVLTTQNDRGRFAVTSWYKDTLRNVDESLSKFLENTKLSSNDDYSDKDEQPSLKDMALATVAPPKKSTPSSLSLTYANLLEVALFQKSLKDTCFAEAILRQKVEMAVGKNEDGFNNRLRSRAALIKLYFRKYTNAENHTQQNHPSYLCGRLLAVLDKIHDVAHRGKTASSPANRFYSSASTMPALVFPRLETMARIHLDKLSPAKARKYDFGVPKEKRADNEKDDFEGLTHINARLDRAAHGAFPKILTLEEQGRFALGFYYERERCQRHQQGYGNIPIIRQCVPSRYERLPRLCARRRTPRQRRHHPIREKW